MKMPQVLKIPKIQLAIILFLLYLSSLLQNFSPQYLYLFIYSLLFTIGSDLLITYFRKGTLFRPYAAIVTALILSLLIDPALAWYEIAIISIIAMASKNLLRIEDRHIFNPASFGLFLGGLILSQPVAWWGVSSQYISDLNPQRLTSFLLILSAALVSGLRMKRYVTILSFMAVYLLTIFLTRQVDSASLFNWLVDPTFLFFSLVMLPEPMTSPVRKKYQAMFGVLVAILSFVLPQIEFISKFLPDAFIPALLIGNLIFFKYK